MASITVRREDLFPNGTAVSAYQVTSIGKLPASGAPSGSAVDSRTVSGGSVTLTGLVEAASYWLYASSPDRYLRVFVPLSEEQDDGSLPPGIDPALAGLSAVDHGIIFTRNTANSWEAGLAEGPAIFRDPVTLRWGMTYVGYDKVATDPATVPKIGLAWSDDLVNWKRASSSPMFAGTGVVDDVDCTVTGPFMWTEDGTYYLFYIGCSAVGFEAGTKRICLATASSISGPWTRRGAIISPTGVSSGAGAWRGIACWHPNVVKVDGTYHMFFNASGYGDVADERIGHASASTPVGPWTVDAVEVLAKGGGGTWDSLRVNDPCVYKAGDLWLMAYGGVESGTFTTRDGLAWTTEARFPYGWAKLTNPVLSPSYGSGSGGGRPFIVNTSAGHFHFFTAQGTGQNAIALAMQGNAEDGPWHYIGGGGDNTRADVMDSAWFPAFNANWSNFDAAGATFPMCSYRVLAGGEAVQLKGLAKHAGVLSLTTAANSPFSMAVHVWPQETQSGGSLAFDAGSSLDTACAFRIGPDGTVAVTVGPTAANSGYWLDAEFPR